MQITLAGALLLPLCAVFCFSADALLVLLQAGSVLGAAAAIVVGGAGISPALIPATLFIGCMALQALLGAELPGARSLLRFFSPMIILALYGLASAVILPKLFDGQMVVWPEKPEPPIDWPLVLHSSSGNLTQSIYFAVNFSLLCAATIFLAPRPVVLVRQLNVFLYCGYTVCGICLWQLANALVGLPFPEDFFYSNPGWTILAHQGLNGVPRVSGPFTEPAGLAFSLCGTMFSCAWLLLRGHRHRLVAPLLLLSLICVCLSTSTSAFAALAIGLVFCLLHLLFSGIPQQARRLLRYAAPVSIGACLIGAILVMAAPGLTKAVTTVIEETLDKGNSSSFESRTTADRDSMALVFPTYGFGAGLGSNRSSSLIAGLLATMGVPGVAFPAWFIVRLYQRVRRLPPRAPHSQANPSEAAMARDGFAAALCGNFLVALLSGPMIVSPIFFLELAGLVAAVVQIEAAGRRLALAVAPRAIAPRLQALQRGGMLCVVALLSTGPAHAAEPRIISNAAEPQFTFGVGTHFAQAPQTLLQSFSLLRGHPFGSIRDEIYWGNVETARGYLAVPLHSTEYIEQAYEQGLHPLLVLDYANRFYDNGDKPRSPQAVAAFARYAGTVAAKFRTQVSMYEVWNEWGNGLGHTTPGVMTDYLPLLHATAAAIRAANPKALVLADDILWSDGREGVIEQAIQLGALRDADGITLHPYFYNRGAEHTPEALASYLQTAQTRMSAANGGKPVPLYITEIGWPSSIAPDGVTTEIQAAYAARVFILAKSLPFVAGLWWYDLRNDGMNPGNNEHNFGLAQQNFTPKPAFNAVNDWLTHLAGAQYVGPVTFPTDTPTNNVMGLLFRVPGKGAFRAVWSTDDAPHVVSMGGKNMSIGAMPVWLAGDGK
jgi:hypothetical protein